MNWHQQFGALLAALCTTFLVSTVWLYTTNDRTNRQLSSVTKSVVARVYASQLHAIRLTDALDTCTAEEACDRKDIETRTVRLARSLGDLVNVLGPARRANLSSHAVGKFIAKYGAEPAVAGSEQHGQMSTPQPDFDPKVLAVEVAPLGPTLQGVMSEHMRELSKSLRDEPPVGLQDVTIAFSLLVLSGAGLTGLLGVELRQRGKLLRQIRAMHEAESEWQRGTVRLLQSLPVPVLLMNADGLAYANQSARSLAAVPGQIDSLSTLAQTLFQQFDRISTEGTGSRDFTYFHGDGTLRQLSASISEIRLTGGRHRVYVLLDNTLLRDAELRAMTSGKLAVLGELSSAIAHELNQPLAVIKAAAANGKLLAGSLEVSKPVVEKFDRIDHQIERARRIIGNVRKLGHPRQPAETPFHVARSLSSTFGLVSEQYRLAGVALEIDVDLGDAVTVIGDYTMFEIAVLNILLNARDAFESGQRSSALATVRVMGRFSEGMVRIEIQDNAGGILPALLPNIFDSFVSSKSADKGTGLGLSIARRAIEDMRGSIAAENVGDGALFTILLPALVKEAVA